MDFMGKRELNELLERMLPHELTDRLLRAYHETLTTDDICEREYEAAVIALRHDLRPKEAQKVRSLEEHGLALTHESVQFAFFHGVRASFRQCYSPCSEKNDFLELMLLCPLEWPSAMKNLRKCMNLDSDAFEALINTREDAEKRESLMYHFISISCAWSDRQYGSMRFSFYLGYCFGLSILARLEPRKYRQMKREIQEMERELGLPI